MAVEKAMGLKKGEKIKNISECVCVSNAPEPLDNILSNPVRSGSRPEVDREGFPDLSPMEFVIMFCQEMQVLPITIVNRIEFRYSDPAAAEVCNHAIVNGPAKILVVR